MLLRSVLALLSAVSCFGQAAPDPSLRQIEDVPGLPRVLLIGDSISMGYTESVRTALKDKANVHRIPVNGATSAFGLQNLEAWLGTGSWDIIHFNFGFHDLMILANGANKVPLADYESNLRAIVQRFKRTGARLIWATTTPVPGAKVTPVRRNADVIAYNAAARKIMDESGVTIDDLYAFVNPRMEELVLPANVHYTASGYAALGRQVAENILRALESR